MNFFRGLFNSSSKEVEYFETLQKRVDEKFKFFEFVHGHMKDFTKILKTFYEKIESHTKKLDTLSHTLEDQYLYDTYQLINQKIVDNIKNDYALVEENLKLLDAHLKKYKTEIDIYNKLKDIYGALVATKEELKSNKTSYHKSGPDMESKMKKFVANNDMNSLSQNLKYQLGNIVRNSKKALKNYEESLTKVNNFSVDFNKKQEELFNYLPNFGKDDDEFFSIVTQVFLNSMKNNTNLIEADKKLMNNIEKSKKKDDLNNLIIDTTNNKKVQRNIELVQYQTSLEFSKCKDQTEFDLFAKVIEAINKNMEEPIFPNYNYDIDLKNYNQSKLIKQIFEMKEVDEKAEKELLDSLDDKMNHKAIFIVLSQLRTNSTFQRPKSFITSFGKVFNKLLSMANKNEIIESQTYFYLDEDKKKRYLFEEIKSNKILNNSKFWRKFIDNVIKSEFDRFKNNHLCPDYDIEKCDTIPDKTKKKLDEIVFSQLLSFITNLSDFDMDKKIIVKIADEFVEKYKYLSKTNMESIYQIIAKDKEEIEKYRKEYDASLESDEIEFKDEEEEKKEEIKEEQKIEDKKEEEKKVEDKKEEKVEDKKEEKLEEKKEEKMEEKKEEKKEEEKKDEKKEEKKDENNIEEENLDNNEIKNE